MTWEAQGQLGAVSARQVLLEESARVFMNRVYRWMFTGVALTAAVAFYVATNPELMRLVAGALMPILVAKLLLVMAFSYLAPRVSGPVAAAMFLTYSASTGLVFSMLFQLYQLGSLGEAFAVSAGAFAAMSIYGTVTRKDLSAWATFLFMGLFGVVIAGVVQLFVQSPGLSFVSSCACVVVFAGLTAYDTQKLRALHAASGYGSSASLAISGALTLYLDFINLFLAILRLMGRRR